MTTTGRIIDYDGRVITVATDENVLEDLARLDARTVELRVDDGRRISAGQRKKIFAIVREISDWSGHDPEDVRRVLTWSFRSLDGGPDFSLSTVDMTTAREFLSYLIEFCFQWGVPTRDSLLERAEDIDKYLWLCLRHRKCAICNAKAQVHHVDAVGMGRDRARISHQGMRVIALCPRHHREAHQIGPDFFDRHHVYGIRLDRELCKALGLKEKQEEP